MINGEYIVEVSSQQNQQLLFGPTMTKLRGRWDTRNTAGKSMHPSLASLSSAHFIPGLRIRINIENRTLEVFDPLGTPEFKSTLDLLEKAAKNHPELFGTKNIVSVPPAKIENATNDQLKDWLYWVRRAFDNEKAIVVGDQPLPAMDEIKAMPGKRRQRYGSNSFLKPSERFADAVDDKSTGGKRSRRQHAEHAEHEDSDAEVGASPSFE